MRILLAPDSFKDSLSALAVCEAIKAGILAASPNEEVRLFPLADGGEGTVDILHWHLGGEKIGMQVHDPLFRPVGARFFLYPKASGKKIAFVEMAQASGLQLLTAEERNPLKTSTFGTGELVLEAIRRGATELYLTIGGSATNDAGMGMAAAMGWQFLDENGVELRPIGENLGLVAKVQAPSTNLAPSVSLPNIQVLCDVDNPLFGPNGAAHVFAPQKGAGKATVQRLDEGLRQFSKAATQALGHDFAQQKGAGAAGGLGFGAMAFLGAKMAPGADTVMQLTGFEAVAQQMDLIITGEGKLDAQTGSGKLVSSLAKTARKLGVPVGAICGSVEASEAELQAMGLSFAVQLKKTGEPLSKSIAKTAERLHEAAHNVLKTMQL
jgi:glycerate kinase